MRSLRALIVRLFNLFGRKKEDGEFAEEMKSHLEMHIEDNLRSGMNPEEARRQALLKLGGLDKTYEECRDRLGFRWMADMYRDFRHSLRRLVKSPLLSLVVILSLGLGIGANTAIYSMMRQVLLRSLPVEKPDELALITASGNSPFGQALTQSGGEEYVFSYQGFRRFEDRRQQDLAEIAGFRNMNFLVTYNENTVRENVLFVSGGYFQLMRVRPFMGRMLMPDDDRGDGNPVAVLGYNFWKTRLGGRADILNQSIHIRQKIFTVVGIAPKGFYGTTVNVRPDVFIPITTAVSKDAQTPFASNILDSWVYLVARLRPGLTREQATAAYEGVYASIVEDQIAGIPGFIRDKEKAIRNLKSRRLQFIDGSRGYSLIQDESRTPLYILIAVTGIILLIAMANAANLLLARTAARHGELATCSAIGASRGRIMGQLFSEALILAVAGGIMGIAIAALTQRLLIALMAPTSTPIDFLTVQPEWPVLLFGFGLSVLTGLTFGLFPALQAVRVSPVKGLIRNSGRVSESFGAPRVRKALVCVQVTLSIILLIPTGLLLKSLVNIMNVDLGLRTENLIAFGMTPYEAGYDLEKSRALYERVERELAALPGITGVTSADTPLLDGRFNMTTCKVENASGGEPTWTSYNWIAAGFFGHMGIPLIQGREFTERDNPSGKNVVIISEQFAKTLFPDRNPLGRNIDLFGSGYTAEIVGVLKDSRLMSVRKAPSELVYLPWLQSNLLWRMFFFIRTGLPPDRLMSQLRQVLREMDPSVPLSDMRTMEDQIRLNIYNDRAMLQLAGLFAVLALSLAMLGLYGVIAYSVVRRTREFGIRIAVGAQPSGIRRMVLREMAMILLAGLIVGIPVVVAICNVANSQWLSIAPWGPPGVGNPENRLFGVSVYDPIVIAGACIALGLAALVATYLPAWRASRIDPMVALRCE